MSVAMELRAHKTGVILVNSWQLKVSSYGVDSY